MGLLTRATTAALLAASFVVPGGVAAGPCTGAQAEAQSATRHAGLVVSSSAGTQMFCVAFTAAEESRGFTGVDLLERSGLSVVYGGTRSAASVCRIGDLGCVDPGSCFCECPVATAPDCRFWGYYTLGSGGAWTFSDVGPSDRRIRDGDVDAWRYSSHAPGAKGPAATTFAAVCAKGVRVLGARTVRSGARSSPAGLVAALAVAGAFAAGTALVIRRRRAREQP